MTIKALKFVIAILLIGFFASCNQNNTNVITLNGEWLIKPLSAKKANPVTIPGNLLSSTITGTKVKETPLNIPEEILQTVLKEPWEISTEFSVPFGFYQNEQITMVLGNLRGDISVYLNEDTIYQSNWGCYLEEIEVKHALSRGTNKLRIVFNTPTEKLEVQNMLYRLQTSGIFELPYLKAWKTAKISNVQFITDALEPNRAWLTTVFSIQSEIYTEAYITIRLEDNKPALGGRAVQLVPGLNEISLPIEIANPKIWQTGKHTTDIKYLPVCELIINNEPIHQLKTDLGIRIAEFKTDSATNRQQFLLNYTPQKLFGIQVNALPAGKEIAFVEKIKEAGINLIQLSGFYAPESFYKQCDSIGIMIGQQLSISSNIAAHDSLFEQKTKKEFAKAFMFLRKHPSVMYYFGEKAEAAGMHNEKLSKIATEMLVEYDMQRSYFPISPVETTKLIDEIIALEPETLVTDSLATDSIMTDTLWVEEPQFVLPESDNLPSYSNDYMLKFYYGLEAAEKPNLPVFKQTQTDIAMLDSHLKMFYPAPKYFKYLAYLSQVAQGDLLMAQTAELKASNLPQNRILYKYNHSLPGLDESILDYDLHPKAAWYMLKQANELPFVVHHVTKGTTKYIYIENNTSDNASLSIPVSIINFAGKEVQTETKLLQLAAYETKQVYELSKLNFSKKAAPEDAFLLVEIVKDEKKLHSEPIYYTEVKNLKLQNPKLKTTWVQNENTITITVSSENLAKNVVVEVKNIVGTFNKNYVDIVPGVPVEFVYSCTQLKQNAKPEIEIYSMFNAAKRTSVK